MLLSLFVWDSSPLIVCFLEQAAEVVYNAYKLKSLLPLNSLDLFIDLPGNKLLFCN